MSGARLVTIAMEYSTSSAQRSLFTVIHTTQHSRKTSITFDSWRIDSCMEYAISGMPTFSSKFERFAAAQVTVASLPITLQQTCITASLITGFTFPGMIDDPGC